MKGNVKFFNTGKGFGFIAGEDGKEYFVHVSAVAEGTVLRENDAVSFDVVEGDRGPKADNVSLDDGSAAPAEEAPVEEAPVEEAPVEEAEEEPVEEAEEEKE
ncbi:cold-shock protein [Candidatus Woesearchaeota archaeon]|nr:cold-shock protein [Candidatus Woesearchaeota archaeon]